LASSVVYKRHGRGLLKEKSNGFVNAIVEIYIMRSDID